MFGSLGIAVSHSIMAYIKLKKRGIEMRVLVTGSEGSLMQAVIPKLIAAGHTVFGVDNLVRYGERLGHAGDDYTFIRGDLVDPEVVENVFRVAKPSLVIQAAARIYGVGGFNAYCADILGEDVSLHNNILKAAVRHGAERVVYISSSMVYENCPQHINIRVSEDMPDEYNAPYTDYGLSKFVGERLSRAFSKQYGLDYTVWRPFNIITPYEKAENILGHSHVFADYINNIVIEKKNPLPIIGDGTQIRCFTWIDEVAEAIATYSFSPLSVNEVFNLGNAEPITMIDLANIINTNAIRLGLLEEQKLSFDSVAEYPNDVMIRIPDVSKAKSILNWEAKVKVNESVRSCLERIS
jgi:nucleoside-diphosphate-sugar epimerase